MQLVLNFKLATWEEICPVCLSNLNNSRICTNPDCTHGPVISKESWGSTYDATYETEVN